MFVIRSNFDEKISIQRDIETVKNYFSDVSNYVRAMAGVESIRSISASQNKWTIRVNFPVIGDIKQEFLVEKSEDSSSLIEWIPAQGETQNLLRYAADFQSSTNEETIVKLTQNVELRRDKASDLHFLAGMAGEAMISQEMTRHITKMLSKFLADSKLKLENS